MNAALGVAGVVLGLCGAVGGIVTAALGLGARRKALLHQIPSFVALVLLGAVLAFGAMERALITRDFSVKFVADHGSSRTPALYNFATLWSALEGSILLWMLVLAGYVAAVTFKFR